MKTKFSVLKKGVILSFVFLLSFSCRKDSTSEIESLEYKITVLSRNIESISNEIQSLLDLLQIERPVKEYKERIWLVNETVKYGEPSIYDQPISQAIMNKTGWNYIKAEPIIKRNDHGLGSISITSSTPGNFKYINLMDVTNINANTIERGFKLDTDIEIVKKDIFDSYISFENLSNRFEKIIKSRKILINSSHPVVNLKWSLTHGNKHWGPNNDEHGHLEAGIEITYRKINELDYTNEIQTLFYKIKEMQNRMILLNKEIQKSERKKIAVFDFFDK